MSYSVTQNTSFFTVASVLQKVISFFYFALIARLIGVENTGIYFFAIAFSTVFTVIADFGMGPTLTRQTARYPEDSQKYLNTVFYSKLLFGILVYGLMILSVNLLNYPDLTKKLVYLAGITVFFDNIHNIFYAIFRARKNLLYESFGVVGSQALTLIIGTLALIKGWPLYFLILAFTIPSFLNAIYSGYFVHKIFKISLALKWDNAVFKSFVIMGIPFALAGIISRFYSYSDSILMSKMLDEKQLGLWSVVYKFSTAFQFIPIALSSSIYPVFSNFFIHDKASIAPLYEKAYRYLFFLAFPVMGGVFVLAGPVIKSLYGQQYNSAVPVLQVLLFSMVFVFITYVNGALLNAIDKQKIQTSLIAGALVLSIIMNIILLPGFQILGAGMVAVIANICLALAGYQFCRHYIIIRQKNIFKYFNQTFWPALFMAIIVHYLLSHIHFLFTIPIGAAIYFALTFATGALNKEIISKSCEKLHL
ncbi:MAG: flippase [bacterium]